MVTKEEVDKVIEEKLTNHDKAKMVAVAQKGARYWMNLYKKFCPNCRKRVVLIVQRKQDFTFDKLCARCQDVAKSHN